MVSPPAKPIGSLLVQRPAAGRSPPAEADQPGVGVVQPAGEAEGLEAGIGVANDPAEGVVAQFLGDGPSIDVDSRRGLPR
ncbi:MAG: hypothetical protein GWN30_20930 [Gammaproteobacteria bacterium]|nr:hypothetical protein [Gammaproteobacteria bacterium]NIX00952.1 hypothetical protein [Phycisphaerae bacterium]